MLDPAENEKWNSLDRRVERLEEDMTDVKASLRSIEGKVDSLVEGVAEIRGRISQSPTWLQLLLALIATWGAGAPIVATAIRFTPK
jgi:chromosome segregation ATPase